MLGCWRLSVRWCGAMSICWWACHRYLALTYLVCLRCWQQEWYLEEQKLWPEVLPLERRSTTCRVGGCVLPSLSMNTQLILSNFDFPDLRISSQISLQDCDLLRSSTHPTPNGDRQLTGAGFVCFLACSVMSTQLAFSDFGSSQSKDSYLGPTL